MFIVEREGGDYSSGLNLIKKIGQDALTLIHTTTTRKNFKVYDILVSFDLLMVIAELPY